MEKIIIEGGKKLNGTINLQGSKNSVLPIISASIIFDGETVIHNCPDITDVDYAVKITEHLGCKIKREGKTLIIDSSGIDKYDIPDNLMRETRSSILFLGALMARFKKACLTYPGGCELGPRPIDLHLSAFKRLGIKIDETHGIIDCEWKNAENDTQIILPIPSVGATENIILCASTCKKEVVIRNAAKEPEIVDLCNFLVKAGVEISGAGESTVTVKGKNRLKEVEHSVIPDRIAAVTYLTAAASTGGDLEIKNIIPSHIFPVIPTLTQAGCEFITKKDSLQMKSPEKLKQTGTITTGFYPCFPTDSQPSVMAMSLFSDNTTVFVENIFQNRYKHIEEFVRLGAKIKVSDRVAVVFGGNNLTGAKVKSTDLRGGAALCVAGLGCEGVTEIDELKHIQRGYEDIVGVLSSLGASIKYS